MSATLGDRALIPAARMGALVDAAALLAEARAMRDGAAAAAREAAEAGRRDGFAAGLEEGRALFASRIAEVVARAEAKLADLETPLAGLIADAVETIVGDMPRPERVMGLVRRALRDINVAGPVTLLGPAEAVEALRQAATEIDSRLTIAADPLLTDEELVLDVMGTRIHIGAPDQLGRLRESLGHG